jgi:HD-like signal output (HDOD) protein|tara:strand:- start:703 stop:894 length:192 start_codon:yes stop_codon:yes gene_type:complete
MNEINEQINKKSEEIESLFDNLLKEISFIKKENVDIDDIEKLLKDYKSKIKLSFSDTSLKEEE